MVEIVSNLLKLTDYPFAYSFTGLLFSILGFGPIITHVETFGPLLLIAGIMGTTLSIIDPVGKLLVGALRFKYTVQGIERVGLIRFRRVRRELYEQEDSRDYYQQVSSAYMQNVSPNYNLRGVYIIYMIKAISSTWITYEINKLVSLVYFAILLSVFVYFVFNGTFIDVLCGMLIKNANITNQMFQNTGIPFNKPACISRISQYNFPYLVLAADILVIAVIFFSYRKLFEHRLIVAVYFQKLSDIRSKEIEIEKESNKINEGGYETDQISRRNENVNEKTNEINKSRENLKEVRDFLDKKDWTMAKILLEEFDKDKKLPGST